ncbi:sigma-54 interaction domain-containing protein [Desulfurispora thermophila]|uniref:sigma-54 interaction domain-containing protein n=1 Tax=Desulfurispora thermophila TaxID=265470 RepID=UPI00037DF5EA|nr:sigma-54-dependent Fis family transcriptional regulator [Desulfurispora thermophila]
MLSSKAGRLAGYLLPVLVVPTGLNIRQARQLAGRQKVLVVKEQYVHGLITPLRLHTIQVSPEDALENVICDNYRLVPPEVLEQELEAWLVELIRQPLLVGGEQELLGVIASEHVLRALWQTVQEQASVMHTLLNLLDEAICIVDSAGRVAGWNQAAEKMYNYSTREIVGKKLSDYFSNLVVSKVMRNDEVVRANYHHPCPERHVLINAAPVKLGDKIIGGISVERDISETVQLNQELNLRTARLQELEARLWQITGQNQPWEEIRGSHSGMKEVLAMARKIAATDATVVIKGERGSGRELLAQTMHRASRRGQAAFARLDCAGVSGRQWEELLFGGPQTPGMLADLSGGTLFISALEDLPAPQQYKLLRLMRDGRYVSAYDEKVHRVDVRYIFSTTEDLATLYSRGRLREDLYYQLNVVVLSIPPLRERKEDIPELFQYFAKYFADQHGKEIQGWHPLLMSALLSYDWPGNVRELRNAVEHMVLVSKGKVLQPADLPVYLSPGGEILATDRPPKLWQATEHAERELISRVLQQTGGNRSRAAKVLGVPRSTLYYKMKKLNLL